MEWTVPFVIFRSKEAGKFEEVFQTSDFKKAKYWLTYIAEVGDVLCRTPTHPKYCGSVPTPEYWSHKVGAGAVESDINKFSTKVCAGGSPGFPSNPARTSDSYNP